MYGKKIVILAILLCILTACCALSEQTELEKIVEQADAAIPEEHVKQNQTEVYDFVFRDEENNTMVYYICQTVFYAADRDAVSGIHVEAVSAVFDVENATRIKELEASGHPAAIYQGENRHFICCTISPEVSVVLEYSPGNVSEQDAILVIRSIFEGTDAGKRPNHRDTPVS